MDAQSSQELFKPALDRHAMVVQNLGYLQDLAHRARFKHNLENTEAVIVCIKVDSRWRFLVDQLMPSQEQMWQTIRDQGQEPIVMGAVSFSICDLVAEVLFDITDALLEEPSAGMYKCIALDENGGTVYEIEPAPKIIN